MRIPPQSQNAQLFGRMSAQELGPGLAVLAADVTRTLQQRTPTSDEVQSSSTCLPGDKSPVCQKPVGSADTQTLPIILGAVIPITCALVVFFFLHRRYLKKQKLEDENDKYKSLDFGVAHVGRAKAGVPEMTVTDLGSSPLPGTGRYHGRGMSLDVMSPYLLPSGVHDSRESLHSLSRSLHDEHDPYRPVAALRDMHEATKQRLADNASIYSMSTGKLSSHEKANLVTNAQRMSRITPRVAEPVISMPPGSKATLEEFVLTDLPAAKERELPPPPPPPSVPPTSEPVGAIVLPPRTSSVTNADASRKNEQLDTKFTPLRESSEYGDAATDIAAFPPAPSEPVIVEPEISQPIIESAFLHPDPSPQYDQGPTDPQAFNVQRFSVMGMRPLPPDNLLVEDNPEQRANRIRSFYKEYFDDSKADVEGSYDFDLDEWYDGAVYDEDSGQFVMASKPFAQAPGRRAMTPPPRGAAGPPRFSGHRQPHRRQFSSMSHARGRTQMVKRHLAPPRPLNGLPTPSKLDLDSAIAHAIDFAPPTSFRDTQNGRRPDSPAGIKRPYSPAVRPYTPLASAYDDLAVMPSPHLLRKSGTFTALDFAPPRLRPQEVMSDAGSIRSARSGISAVQMDAVRAGAYRVSRIPREMVTTREDLSNQLRPKLNMVTPA